VHVLRGPLPSRGAKRCGDRTARPVPHPDRAADRERGVAPDIGVKIRIADEALEIPPRPQRITPSPTPALFRQVLVIDLEDNLKAINLLHVKYRVRRLVASEERSYLGILVAHPSHDNTFFGVQEGPSIPDDVQTGIYGMNDLDSVNCWSVISHCRNLLERLFLQSFSVFR
jgi:hypothetical protein